MQIGIIGLGRMGANLVRRLTRRGHRCVVHDLDAAAAKRLAGRSVRAAESLHDLAGKLAKPRAVWIMVPAGAAGKVIEEVAAHLDAGDIIIDGGNSHYHDDLQRAGVLREHGIHFIDCGTSGGVFGLERGFCLMIGGEARIVKHLDPIFRSIAPGVGAATRTPGRAGKPDSAEQGYLHCGPAGAGHFVKMVHNGIEYGLMASYAEGMNILHHANAGRHGRSADAETAPLRDPDLYRYDFDLAAITEVWRRGSVISSWLLDLTAASLQTNSNLKNYGGRVSDSGEGRWTVAAAIDEGVPVPVLSAALYERFSSRGRADFGNRVLSAMREQFGGHTEKKSAKRTTGAKPRKRSRG